jgi:hypothetical protein
MLMFHELKHAAQFLHWSKRQLEINFEFYRARTDLIPKKKKCNFVL